MFFSCYLAPNILGGHSGPFSLHLSHQDSVWLCLKPLEIGGAGGAINLHTWYYTTLLGQHRREGQLFRDLVYELPKNINQHHKDTNNLSLPLKQTTHITYVKNIDLINSAFKTKKSPQYIKNTKPKINKANRHNRKSN